MGKVKTCGSACAMQVLLRGCNSQQLRQPRRGCHLLPIMAGQPVPICGARPSGLKHLAVASLDLGRRAAFQKERTENERALPIALRGLAAHQMNSRIRQPVSAVWGDLGKVAGSSQQATRWRCQRCQRSGLLLGCPSPGCSHACRLCRCHGSCCQCVGGCTGLGAGAGPMALEGAGAHAGTGV